MSSLSYRTFVWPQNPHTYREVTLREPRFVTVDGEKTFSKMGDLQRTIVVEGVFHGETAFASMQALVQLAQSRLGGNLEHPVWGIRYCLLTGLEFTQEPRPDYVAYRATFTGLLGDGSVAF